MEGIDKDGIRQPVIGHVRKPSEGRRRARLGKKATEATKAKLRITNSRPRGCYTELWGELYALTNTYGFTFKRIRNWWLLYDPTGTEYAFMTLKDALAYLKGNGKWNNQIYTLCYELGYTFKRYSDSWWDLFDQYGARIFTRCDARTATGHLEHMKKWRLQRGDRLRKIPVEKVPHST